MRRYLSLRWRRFKRHLRSCAEAPVVNRIARDAFAETNVMQHPGAEGSGHSVMPVRDRPFTRHAVQA